MLPLLKPKASQMAAQECGLKVITCQQVTVLKVHHLSTILNKEIPKL